MDESYVDEITKDALMSSTAGLDLDVCQDVIKNSIKAMQKMSKSLADADYDPERYEAAARSLNHVAKQLSELYRLMQFSKGQPDSRPAIGADWLQALTDTQFEQVMAWVEANQRGEPGEAGEGGEDRER